MDLELVKCCDNCLDEATCGAYLDILSESAGIEIRTACECGCSTASDRRNLRQTHELKIEETE